MFNEDQDLIQRLWLKTLLRRLSRPSAAESHVLVTAASNASAALKVSSLNHRPCTKNLNSLSFHCSKLDTRISSTEHQRLNLVIAIEDVQCSG